MTELERFPLEALVSLVNRETELIHADVLKYGEHQFDPRTPAWLELGKRFDKVLEQETDEEILTNSTGMTKDERNHLG